MSKSGKKISLIQQREAVVALVVQAGAAGVPVQKENLQAVCETLLWLGKYEKQIKLGIQIADKAMKDDATAALVSKFTGLALVDVRQKTRIS